MGGCADEVSTKEVLIILQCFMGVKSMSSGVLPRGELILCRGDRAGVVVCLVSLNRRWAAQRFMRIGEW